MAAQWVTGACFTWNMVRVLVCAGRLLETATEQPMIAMPPCAERLSGIQSSAGRGFSGSACAH